MSFLQALAALWLKTKHRIPITSTLSIRIFSIFMFVCLTDAQAQFPDHREAAEGQTGIIPLRIGDTVPEEFWMREHLFYLDGDTIRQSLSGYRGRTLLFDFWATWCSACIRNMPKVDSLFNRPDPQSKILYVTTDGFDKVHAFRGSNAATEGIDMEIILEDKILQNYFPHSFIPHYAIVRRNGTVAAQVNELEMDGALIRRLTDDADAIVGKEYTTDGKTQPFFLADRYGKENGYRYSFFREGYDPIFGGANIKRRNGNGVYSLTLANVPLKTLVFELGKLYAETFGVQFNPDFIEGYHDTEQQYVTYEFAVPEGEEAGFFNALLGDVQRYVPIAITPNPKKKQVLVIAAESVQNEGARTALARTVQTKLDNRPIVLDYTDSYRHKDLVIEGADLQGIRKSLARFGYTLAKKTMLLPYILIERRNDETNR